jgi:GntR family transcriptional repressor for pyruvate dehydrogenase complex
VVQQVRDLIASGRLQPGERLPTERELGEMLSVGRSTVREALRALMALGVVRRGKGGLYVSDGPPSLASAISASTVQETFEARRLFELDLAGLAAERADASDLAEIARWLPVGVPDVETFKGLDVGFHGAVARAAHNRVVVELFEAVREILFRSHAYYTALDSLSHRQAREFVRKTVADHVRIYEAITQHRPREAREAMEAHFRHLERAMLSRLV